MNTTRHVVSGAPSGLARAGYLLRHLLEMLLAMMVGMAAGAGILILVFSTVLASKVEGRPSDEAVARYPVLVCLVVAAGMTVTMAAWMRHRGMAWRPVAEMSAAMVVPLVPIFALLWLGTIAGASACGVYCTAMVPAMLVAMLLRLDLYATGHTGHAVHVGTS
jgi:cytochrome bd-type quinol oxidase subunit 2